MIGGSSIPTTASANACLIVSNCALTNALSLMKTLPPASRPILTASGLASVNSLEEVGNVILISELCSNVADDFLERYARACGDER